MARGPRRLEWRVWAAVLVCGAPFVVACGLGLALWSATGLPPVMALHGALMIAAWGVLLPAGSIVARYFKVLPHQNFPAAVDNPFWWRWHRVLQYGGVAFATAGLIAILFETGGRFDTVHGKLGLAVMVMAWLQVASAAVRGSKGGPTDEGADPIEAATWRGDHYDMSRHRLLFESWHKRAGWVATTLAGVTLLLGAALVGAPAWLLLLIAVMQGAALFAVIDSIVRQRWVDTYQALWGPDPVHPGNRHRSAPGATPLRGRSPP